ncbi:MAG: adenine deaminase [Erysipelotrichaceae bacterium]|nr:adenine deaminase [Erysipelotrichaceae bacterium]
MKTLLTNGKIFNVFTRSLTEVNVLLNQGIIAGMGSYTGEDADEVIDLEGKILSPGLFDSHMHIESTMLTPFELSKALLPFGTTAVVADPHEIANVCGTAGIEFMLQGSRNLPLDFFFVMPSCVPATAIQDSGAVLLAEDLRPFYDHPRVIGLAEVMNVPAVLNREPQMIRKIKDAVTRKLVIDGHAPMLAGKDLDAYIRAGVLTDHECANLEEAVSKIEKGMVVLIRQGTAAKNLKSLMGLFKDPYCSRACLCTDDKHPDDLLETGHINSILKEAVSYGADPLTALQMATWNPANTYQQKSKGAIAPGYDADLVLFDDLKDFTVSKVWKNGRLVYSDNQLIEYACPKESGPLKDCLLNTMNISPVVPEQFEFDLTGTRQVHVIGHTQETLLTDDLILDVDFDDNNGANPEENLVKIAVLDRHFDSGAMTLGLIKGTGIKRGAIATSVAHDSHNLAVVGTNAKDMAAAANEVINMSGGLCVVLDGQVLARLSLPAGGLMSLDPVEEAAKANGELREAVKQLGSEQELFMSMAFMSLPVIPDLKITVHGLVDSKMNIVDFVVN